MHSGSTHDNLVESPSGGKLRVPLPCAQVVLQRTYLLCHHIDTAGELEGGGLVFQPSSEETIEVVVVALTSTPSMYLMMFGCRSVFSLRWADCANLICEVKTNFNYVRFHCMKLVSLLNFLLSTGKVLSPEFWSRKFGPQ